MNMTNNDSKKEFLLTYTPAKHEGIDNWRGEEFTYHVSVSGNIFHNREEKTLLAFTGTILRMTKAFAASAGI